MRKKQGIVTSTKMTGTVTVTTHSLAFHPKYKKRYRISKKFLADPGEFTVSEGDLVVIGETRPQSKRKHFTVVEVLKQAAAVGEVKEEKAVEEAIANEKEKPVNEVKKEEEKEEVSTEEVTEESTDDTTPTES